MTIVENPYLTGNLAPVEEEITATDLPVTGTIPAQLEGRWLRNGPNPITPPDPANYHWFTGDGMVHGVRIRGGKAEWYKNRWVRSPEVSAHLGEDPVEMPPSGLPFGANTSVGGFAGRTWAMVEAGGVPFELSYDLEVQKGNDFFGTLPAAFSAHPKYDGATGELHAMCYRWPDLIDKLHYVTVGGDGKVTRTVEIPVADMPMVHDMSLTPNWAVVYDLPVTVDFEAAMTGGFPFGWNANREARIGLLPRSSYNPDEIVWCPVDPCALFHPMNAFEDASGNVVLDVCRFDKMFDQDRRGPFGDALPTLWRWTANPGAATVAEVEISDRPQEFPRHNPKVGGQPYQFGYSSGVQYEETMQLHTNTYKVDLHSGNVTEHDHGVGRGGAEPVFIARDGGTAEDDGWLMVLVYDANRNGSDIVLLDAQDVTAAPVATIQLPQRVPFGFHGDWVSDSSVAP